jgi:hypothetical protein
VTPVALAAVRGVCIALPVRRAQALLACSHAVVKDRLTYATELRGKALLNCLIANRVGDLDHMGPELDRAGFGGLPDWESDRILDPLVQWPPARRADANRGLALRGQLEHPRGCGRAQTEPKLQTFHAMVHLTRVEE